MTRCTAVNRHGVQCRAEAKHDPDESGVMTRCGRHSAANAERMRRRHQDPEFAAAHAERMRRLNRDPEFAAANAERSAERMRRLNRDPEFNPLVALSEQERADYDVLKRAGYTRAEALAAIGREDLIGGNNQ